MPPDTASEVKFEIGHVLFIDIVGYSKLLITEQSDQLQTLREVVRSTEQFKKAEAEGKLLRLPTGDGGALIGRPPMEYLTRWRIVLAARRLRESHAAIVDVAADVGYESESAFNRAFKRQFGSPPAAWRRQAARGEHGLIPAA